MFLSLSTMTTSTNIDYVKTNFEYPTLTKITGQPTFVALRIVKNKLKENAASVPSDLGGGANGHLGLVLKNAQRFIQIPMHDQSIQDHLYYQRVFLIINNRSNRNNIKKTHAFFGKRKTFIMPFSNNSIKPFLNII